MTTTQAVKITGMDANYYFVKDYDRALAFYRDTLGLEVTWSAPAMFAEFTFPGGESFGIYKSDGEFQPGTGIMFSVPDIKAAVEAFKARGVAVGDHIEDTPACYMAFAQDTEGNHFILHQRKA